MFLTDFEQRSFDVRQFDASEINYNDHDFQSEEEAERLDRLATIKSDHSDYFQMLKNRLKMLEKIFAENGIESLERRKAIFKMKQKIGIWEAEFHEIFKDDSICDDYTIEEYELSIAMPF